MLRSSLQINSFWGRITNELVVVMTSKATMTSTTLTTLDDADVDVDDVDVDAQRKEFHLENNLVFAILYSLAHSLESPEMTTG